MCVLELPRIGAYPRQNVDIMPNFKVLPLSWFSHEIEVYYNFVYYIIYYNITGRTATQTELGALGHLSLGDTALWPRTLGDTALWPCCLDGTKAPRPHSLGDTAPWAAVVPSVVSVAGCCLPSCSWGETPPWKKRHRCAVQAEASHHVRRNFWRGYMGQSCLREAFSTWSCWICWCQQLINIWAPWRGMSYAKERWVEGRCTQSAEEFVLWRRDGWVLQLHVCFVRFRGILWYSEVF